MRLVYWALLIHPACMQLDPTDGPRSLKRQTLLLYALALCALVVYLAMNSLMVVALAEDFATRGFAKSLIYILWIVCGFITFSAVVLTARLPVLAVVVLLSCVSVSTNYAYAHIARRDITPDLMEWMAHEVSQFKHAWVEFMPEILDGTVRAAGLIVLFLVIRAVIRSRRLWLSHIADHPRARAIALGAFLVFHGGTMALQPSYTVAEANVFTFGVPALMSGTPGTRKVTHGPPGPPRAQKIVFIIDESVGHKIYAEVIAPQLRDLPIVDFGESASISTCSASSNALLRWGLEKASIGQPGYDPRTNPTIWGYAKAAGFRTTLIDGQSKGATQNFVTVEELALIDHFVGADIGIETDRRIAATLKERLSQPGRELIYVVKRGAHFPYEANYPPGTLAYDAPKKAKYAAAVSYATNGFFAALTEQLPLTDLLLIYTSDHGQNLDARAVHCSDEHHPEEYSTPLVVLNEAPQMRHLLQGAVERMRDRTSHLNVFPTLLYGLGYERDWIEATYGPTLAGPPTPYVTLAWHLPYPTRRKLVVEFAQTESFPGRHAARPKTDSAR